MWVLFAYQSWVLLCQFVHKWCNHAALATPASHEVNHHRLVTCRLNTGSSTSEQLTKPDDAMGLLVAQYRDSSGKHATNMTTQRSTMKHGEEPIAQHSTTQHGVTWHCISNGSATMPW